MKIVPTCSGRSPSVLTSLLHTNLASLRSRRSYHSSLELPGLLYKRRFMSTFSTCSWPRQLRPKTTPLCRQSLSCLIESARSSSVLHSHCNSSSITLDQPVTMSFRHTNISMGWISCTHSSIISSGAASRTERTAILPADSNMYSGILYIVTVSGEGLRSLFHRRHFAGT